MSDFRYFYFEHRFLHAGLIAEREMLVLIDITTSRDEFIANVVPERGGVEDPDPFQTLMDELAEYVDGGRKTFTASVRPGGGAFTRAVLESTANIPYGQVRSYADVAREAGSARAVRAAGNALAGNPFPILIPCHRVVKSGGLLGGFGGGSDMKRKLLALEGFSFDGERVVGPHGYPPPMGRRFR
jgi:methylated-DNA-[protein]-cysteine S-methyltransferase